MLAGQATLRHPSNQPHNYLTTSTGSPLPGPHPKHMTVPSTASWPITLRYLRKDAAQWFVLNRVRRLGTEAFGAVALGVFLGAVTLGRLVGDRLVSRFGAVPVFRAGAIVAGAGCVRLRARADEEVWLQLLPSPEEGLDHAIGRLVSIVFAAQQDGTWSRRKVCVECHWALYDHTKNHSAAWCGFQCGARVRS
jgi:hypothetical protein